VCQCALLDTVHHLNCKIKAFLRLAKPRGPTDRFSVPFYLKMEGKPSFQNVVILSILQFRWWTMSIIEILRVTPTVRNLQTLTTQEYKFTGYRKNRLTTDTWTQTVFFKYRLCIKCEFNLNLELLFSFSNTGRLCSHCKTQIKYFMLIFNMWHFQLTQRKTSLTIVKN
jgi:hypothetical protein